MRPSLARIALPFVLVTGVGFAPSATAHDQLVSTNPGAGATMSRIPTTLSLTFNTAPLDVGNEIVVKTPAGQRKTAVPKQAGTSVSVPFSSAGSGKYQVVWRVVSSDGHPISGEFDFTLTGAGPASGAPSPTSSASGPSTGARGKAPATKKKGSDDSSPGLWIGGGVGVGVVGVLAGLGAWARHRRAQAGGSSTITAEPDDE